jgi:hypothetical protein
LKKRVFCEIGVFWVKVRVAERVNWRISGGTGQLVRYRAKLGKVWKRMEKYKNEGKVKKRWVKVIRND